MVSRDHFIVDSFYTRGPMTSNHERPPIDRVIAIDKPPAMTSRDVVSRVKRLLPRRTKVGHAGTLDRFATGVLLVLIGRSTRRCEELMNGAKRYLATVRLDATSASLDPDTEVIGIPCTPPTREQIEAAVPKFVGTIQQAPPAYSAVKIGGRRSSSRARAGEAVIPVAREVRVDAIEIVDYTWPLLTLRIDSGRGFYVRALARDLGGALGVGGYVLALRRTRVGGYDESTLVALDAIASAL